MSNVLKLSRDYCWMYIMHGNGNACVIAYIFSLQKLIYERDFYVDTLIGYHKLK